MASSRLFLLLLLSVLLISHTCLSPKLALAAEEEEEDYGFDDEDLEGDEEPKWPDMEGDDAFQGLEGEEEMPLGEGEDPPSDEDELYDDEEEGEFLEDNGHVITLTSADFEETVKNSTFLMVEFYAPWCDHCRELAPEYRTAAAELFEEGVTLAKVDATKDLDLADSYGVEGFPTISFWAHGIHRTYTGGRTSKEIVDWVRKKMGPVVRTLTEEHVALETLNAEPLICIGHFEKLEGDAFTEFEGAAKIQDDLLFAATTDAAIAKLFGVSENSIALIKKEDEKFTLYEGELKADKLADFIMRNRLPLVTSYGEDTTESIFGSPIRKLILLFVRPEEYEKISPVYIEAAKSFLGDIIFVHINTTEGEEVATILEFFGVEADEPNPTIIAFTSTAEGRKHLFKGEITAANLKAFGEDFLAGKAEVFLKSDPIPEENDGDVKIVVGKNYDDIVLDESKDVLLEVYAPWCGHCQALEPEFNKLGKRFRSVPSVVIAKMDGTKNEHLSLKIEGFPTVLFFPAGNKTNEPIPVESERQLKPLTQFIKQHAGIPFTLPKRGPKLTKEEVAEQAELENEKLDAEDIKTTTSKDEL